MNAADADGNGSAHRRTLALLTAVLILAMSTWFSASAVIPQLRAEWDLSMRTLRRRPEAARIAGGKG